MDKLILLFIIIVFSPLVSLASNTNVDERFSNVYFANGINTKKKSARISLNMLKVKTIAKYPNITKYISDWNVSYNSTQGTPIDLMESTQQKFVFEWGLKQFDTQWFYDLVQDTYVADIYNTYYPMYNNLFTQVNEYKKQIKNGHGVIVVAHSQGNLFTNEAFNRLDGWMQPYFHMIGVATPAGSVANSGPYVTFDNDFIHYVPGALDGALVTNIKRYSAEVLGYKIDDNPASIEAHYFDSSYMGTSYTRDAILGFIYNSVDSHLTAKSQWQKSYDINCPSSCGHRIIVKHRYDSALDANMSGVPVLPFDAAAKLYPASGRYVKADPAGVRVDSPAGGGVCHRLFEQTVSGCYKNKFFLSHTHIG